jgi:hypothetical protein
MKTNIPFDSSKESKKLITYSSLISDKVKLYVPQYKDYLGTQFYDQKLLDDLNPLEKKGIIELVEVNIPNITSEKQYKEISPIWHSDALKKLIDEYEFLYSQFDSKGYNEHAQLQLKMLQNLKIKLNQFNYSQKKEYVKDFHDVIIISRHPGHYMLKELEKTSALKGEFFRNALMHNINSIENSLTPGYRAPVTGSRRLEDLAMLQLKMFYNLISERKANDETVLANDLLNVALSEINQNCEEYKQNELKLEALEIGIPNYTALDLEDIIRLHESREFVKMRSFVDKIAKDFPANEEGLKETKKYIKNDVKPQIEELKKSIENLAYNTRRSFYDDLMNTKGFVPLIATLIPNIPTFLAPALYLGLLTVQNIDKYQQTKKVNENNDLYFAVKFPKITCNSGGKKL